MISRLILVSENLNIGFQSLQSGGITATGNVDSKCLKRKGR
jgi:hypothetical protein